MRTLKFRAWDEGSKIMHYDFQFFTSGEEDNDWICFSSDKEKRITNNPIGIVFNNPYFRQQLNIMQFTGLLDKNGKEIYEGDIYHQGDRNITYTVVWHDTGLIGKQNGSSSYADIEYWLSNTEVIGNIYENPELVKKFKEDTKGGHKMTEEQTKEFRKDLIKLMDKYNIKNAALCGEQEEMFIAHFIGKTVTVLQALGDCSQYWQAVAVCERNHKSKLRLL